jgi:hypothetical protein
VPYVIEQYRVKSAGDIWQTVTHELPMRDVLVDFGPADGDANSRKGVSRQSETNALE